MKSNCHVIWELELCDCGSVNNKLFKNMYLALMHLCKKMGLFIFKSHLSHLRALFGVDLKFHLLQAVTFKHFCLIQ